MCGRRCSFGTRVSLEGCVGPREDRLYLPEDQVRVERRVHPLVQPQLGVELDKWLRAAVVRFQSLLQRVFVVVGPFDKRFAGHVITTGGLSRNGS